MNASIDALEQIKYLGVNMDKIYDENVSILTIACVNDDKHVVDWILSNTKLRLNLNLTRLYDWKNIMEMGMIVVYYRDKVDPKDLEYVIEAFKTDLDTEKLKDLYNNRIGNIKPKDTKLIFKMFLTTLNFFLYIE